MIKSYDDWRTEETWIPWPYAPSFEVSDGGRVRNRLTMKFLREQFVGPRRYRYRAVWIFGEYHKVATMVLEAHVGRRPPGRQALHRDDDRHNDQLENLYWGTPQDNAIDRENNAWRWWRWHE